ncbi:MAG: helix-turn-helix transcriptional regulator [Cyclobacteriaceae bacterium]|nr:helix-turn-helix transcriptional regulator [Cyclobacteriaceae bacterium]
MNTQNDPQVESQNTSNSEGRVLFNSPDQTLSVLENTTDSSLTLPSLIRKSIIHFYFCLEGNAIFEFGPHYQREIHGRRNYFFFNPDQELPFRLKLAPHSKMVLMDITLERLHELFTHEPLPFLKPENIRQKYYDERDIPANLLVELNQLFNIQLSPNANRLFYQGKILELLALYFSERKPDMENCPFLNNEDMVRKIKNAKEHLLAHEERPPTIRELAKLAGLNEHQLKAGFKEIYGNTVYGYLLDHKLDHARVLLDSQKFQVAQVAYQVGYTNPSHFIAAFKKKFGITPKKYLMAKVA